MLLVRILSPYSLYFYEASCLYFLIFIYHFFYINDLIYIKKRLIRHHKSPHRYIITFIHSSVAKWVEVLYKRENCIRFIKETKYIDARSDFKNQHFSREVIAEYMRWYLQYPISYRNIKKMMLERSVEVDYTTIYR